MRGYYKSAKHETRLSTHLFVL